MSEPPEGEQAPQRPPGTHYDAPSDAGSRPLAAPHGPQPAYPPTGPQPAYPPTGPQPAYPPTAPGTAYPPTAPGTAVWAPPGAPQGAQPGWGGPYPPRPRRPFPWKVVGIVVGVLVLIALIVVGLLAFVVGPRFARVDVLDEDSVAQGVTRVVTEDWHRQITDVSCPADQELRPGARFTCSATVDGRPVQVPVQVVGADGTYAVGQPR